MAVTGVSGSGKSTLVCKVLGDVMARQLGTLVEPADDETDDDVALLDIERDSSVGVMVDGAEAIDRLVAVDQRPIGRTPPRSNLATYTGLFDAVRKAFADTAEARRRGWGGAGRFSFNVAEGRCATCQGEGFVAVELLFPARHLCDLSGMRWVPLLRGDTRNHLPGAAPSPTYWPRPSTRRPNS